MLFFPVCFEKIVTPFFLRQVTNWRLVNNILNLDDKTSGPLTQCNKVEHISVFPFGKHIPFS